MTTEELFEEWGLDLPWLRSHVAELTGARPAVLGGSLASDLGTIRSDIDVFVFYDTSEAPVPAPAGSPLVGFEFASARGASLNIHSASAPRIIERNSALLSLITPGEAPDAIPWLAYQEMVLLHALYAGIDLSDPDGLARLRTDARADLLPLYLVVRGLHAFVSYGQDVLAMQTDGVPWPQLGAVRSSVESLLDAVLATAGYVHPNPKWRVSLALRALSAGDLPWPVQQLMGPLFPLGDSPTKAIEAGIQFCQECIERLGRDALIRSYPVFEESREIAAQLVAGARLLTSPQSSVA